VDDPRRVRLRDPFGGLRHPARSVRRSVPVSWIFGRASLPGRAPSR
jgi:hypothetical protein